jgi:ribose transport system permease protein
MSVLSTGLPAMNLEAHWQTFFTGVIVLGAVLLDMYRNRKASEVRIETAADVYRAEMLRKIAALKAEMPSVSKDGKRGQVDIEKEIAQAKAEMKATFARMKREEKAQQARIRAEERAADHEFSEMLRRKEPAQTAGKERRP